jgi:hypothetical protein
MMYLGYRLGLNLGRFSLKQEFSESETLKEGHKYSVTLRLLLLIGNSSPSRTLPRSRLWCLMERAVWHRWERGWGSQHLILVSVAYIEITGIPHLSMKLAQEFQDRPHLPMKSSWIS